MDSIGHSKERLRVFGSLQINGLEWSWGPVKVHNGLPLLSTLFLRMVRNGLLSYVGTWGPLKKAPIGGTGMDSYGAGSDQKECGTRFLLRPPLGHIHCLYPGNQLLPSLRIRLGLGQP